MDSVTLRECAARSSPLLLRLVLPEAVAALDPASLPPLWRLADGYLDIVERRRQALRQLHLGPRQPPGELWQAAVVVAAAGGVDMLDCQVRGRRGDVVRVQSWDVAALLILGLRVQAVAGMMLFPGSFPVHFLYPSHPPCTPWILCYPCCASSLCIWTCPSPPAAYFLFGAPYVTGLEVFPMAYFMIFPLFFCPMAYPGCHFRTAFRWRRNAQCLMRRVIVG